MEIDTQDPIGCSTYIHENQRIGKKRRKNIEREVLE